MAQVKKHSDKSALILKLRTAREDPTNPQVGEAWKHTETAGIYEILGLAAHPKTGEITVVYGSVDRVIWLRVDQKYDDGSTQSEWKCVFLGSEGQNTWVRELSNWKELNEQGEPRFVKMRPSSEESQNK